MGFYQFERKQQFKQSKEELWNFISNPLNLKLITPKYMGFDIKSKNIPNKIHQGMIIIYKVSPIFKLKTTWVTEITSIEENKYFVDEQKVGPYNLWHHQHILEKNKKGVNMIDIVSYKPPFGIIGNIANKILIKRKIKEIFDYRTKVLNKLFELK